MNLKKEGVCDWVPPNDRELTLRSKLDTGWSCKTNQFQRLAMKHEKISDQEKNLILEVFSRANKSEELEKKRIKKMKDRLDNIKRNARGDGFFTCILCNEAFGLFGLKSHQCQDCFKLVCNKCGIDKLNSKKETVWLCKICAETRETRKKSGFWFYEF